MKHLVITGAQGTGKTLLGQWLLFALPVTHLNDGQTKEQIIKLAYSHRLVKPLIFVTNEAVTYEDLSSNDFLIIKLTDL